jgi:hypothetical protein
MATSLTNILFQLISTKILDWDQRMLTDFMTGVVEYVCVSKLNGLLGGGPMVLPSELLPVVLSTLVAGEGNAVSIEANRGNVPLIGDSELLFQVRVDVTV